MYAARALMAMGLAALFFAMNTEAEHLVIARDGSTSYEIVVPPDAYEGISLAAKELRHYVGKSAQVDLPVRDTPTEGKNHIFLGAEFLDRIPTLSRKDIPPSGYVIATHDNNLFIIGDDTPGDPYQKRRIRKSFFQPLKAGTLFGVYAILEDDLGIRWYMPTELGEIVPRRKEIRISALPRREEPSFAQREFRINPLFHDRAETARWCRRNRCGAEPDMEYGHAWRKMIGEKKYFDRHPEYFAVVNGERKKRSTRHGSQLCTSNPDVIALVAEKILQGFKSDPDATMLTISPNDGLGFCECDACTALDSGATLDRYRGATLEQMPDLTDRMMTFFNSVATIVEKQYPQKKIGVYIYSLYIEPPHRVKPHSMLHLRYVRNMLAFWINNPAEKEHLYEHVRRWGAVHDDVGFFCFPVANRWAFPIVFTQEIPDLLRLLHKNHFYASEWTCCPEWGAQGLDIYLIAKLNWDVNADAEKIVAEYYRDLYAGAAPVMKRYHAALAQRAKTAFKARSYAQTKMGFHADYFQDMFTPDVVDTWIRELTAAQERCDDPLVKQRLGISLNTLAYTRLEVEGYGLLAKMKDGDGAEPAKQFMANKKKSAALQATLRKTHSLPPGGKHYDPIIGSWVYGTKRTKKLQKYLNEL